MFLWDYLKAAYENQPVIIVLVKSNIINATIRNVSPSFVLNVSNQIKNFEFI
jgi:hypothetical protein